MKRNLKTYFTLSLVFLLSLSVFTGCDFFRRLAGRPTSDDIEIKRRAIADEKAEHARNLELLEISRKAIKDSLARADSLRAAEALDDRGKAIVPFEAKYAVLLGQFRNIENAKRLCRAAIKKGYDARLIKRGPLVAVTAGMGDDRKEMEALLQKVRADKLCESAGIIEK